MSVCVYAHVTLLSYLNTITQTYFHVLILSLCCHNYLLVALGDKPEVLNIPLLFEMIKPGQAHLCLLALVSELWGEHLWGGSHVHMAKVEILSAFTKFFVIRGYSLIGGRV